MSSESSATLRFDSRFAKWTSSALKPFNEEIFNQQTVSSKEKKMKTVIKLGSD